MAGIIAAILVMMAINLFMVFAVKKAADRADYTIRRYFSEKMASVSLSDFAKDSAENSSEGHGDVQSPEEKTVVTIKNEPESIYPINTTTETKAVNYKNINFESEYKRVKEAIDANKREIIYEVINQEKMLPSYSYIDLANHIRDRFSFDTIFNLSTLAPEEQIAVLRATLLSGETAVLDSYLKEECRQSEFDAVNFFGHIEQLTKIFDKKYYVMTGWKFDSFEDISENVVTVYDSGICEGIKVMHENRIYDYSI